MIYPIPLPVTWEQLGILSNMAAGILMGLEFIITTNSIKIINEEVSKSASEFICSYKRTILPVFAISCLFVIIVYLWQSNILQGLSYVDFAYILIILFILSLIIFLVLHIAIYLIECVAKRLNKTPKGLTGSFGIALFIVGNILLYKATLS